MADRIREERKARGFSQGELAERAGVKQQMISKLETGQAQSTGDLAAIARALNVVPWWLQTGDGPKHFDLVKDDPITYQEQIATLLGPTPDGAPSEDAYALVPHYNVKGSCGNGHFNDHVEVKGGLAFQRAWLGKLRVNPDDAAVIYASGESMSPTIGDGYVVLLDTTQTEPRHGLIFAFLVDGEIRIKRVFRAMTGEWTLASDNPNKTRYPDESAESLGELAIIGRCVWQGGAL